jgi:hypothetical protein
LAYLIATAIIILFFFFFYRSSDSFLLLWIAKEEGKKECWVWMPTSCCIEVPRRQRSIGFF